MKGILNAHKFEKKADTNLGDNRTEWEEQILGELIKTHPYLADKMNNISIEEIDSDNNRHIGSISLIVRPGTTIEIPIVINDGVMAPLDIFAYKKELYPLSESVIKDTCQMNLGVGVLDERGQNMSTFMESAVTDNTEVDSAIKLSKMLDLADRETINKLVAGFGKYEKIAMKDYYSLFKDTVKLKDKANKLAMEKNAVNKEANEWVGYAYPGNMPYTFDVVMYKKAMETNGEMIRTQKMTAEEMDKSNITIYDEGHVNFKVAYANPNESSVGYSGDLAGKKMSISTDNGLKRAVVFEATDPVGNAVGDKIFVTGNKDWGTFDRKPYVEQVLEKHDYLSVWLNDLPTKDLEDAIGNFVCFVTEDTVKDEYSHKVLGPFCVDRIIRYNRLGEMENVTVIDVHDVNMVRYRLIRTDVSKPALVNQDSDKFKKHYAKVAYDRDVYLLPGAYGIGVLGNKIKLVSKETYDFTKKSALESRADKHITIIRNQSSWDVEIRDNKYIKKLSFLDDNTFDAVCREEMGKYANQLEIPMLSKREYYIWED